MSIDIATSADVERAIRNYRDACIRFGAGAPMRPELIVFETELRTAIAAAVVAAEARAAERERQALLARVDELEAALRALVDPFVGGIGWKGAPVHGDPTETFACELCKVEHVDVTQIPHADDCPVLPARAALAGRAP